MGSNGANLHVLKTLYKVLLLGGRLKKRMEKVVC